MLNMCYNQSNPLWSQSLESRAHMTVKKSLQKGGEFHLYPIINRDITTKLPEYSIHVNSAPVQLFLDCDIDHLLRLFNLSPFLYWSLTICRASPSSILKYKKLPIFIHFVPTETTIPHVQLPIWKQNKTIPPCQNSEILFFFALIEANVLLLCCLHCRYYKWAVSCCCWQCEWRRYSSNLLYKF